MRKRPAFDKAGRFYCCYKSMQAVYSEKGSPMSAEATTAAGSSSG